ncbi:MAG TPA: hypothetical protein VH309_03520, partial [Elusimicrobiota bacterium]|nr:hypothetical protein [Elusimicrobiota bacterium]
MKALPLFACLLLFAGRARALGEAAPDPAPANAASFPGRDAMLAEIDSWRQGQLVRVTPPDPLTAEFEPRLDDIQLAVKLAGSEDDLVQPRKDFKAWQHDLLVKKYAVTRREGLTRGSLGRFSRDQRERVATIAANAAQVSSARLSQTSAQFFDGGGGDSGAVDPGESGGARRASSFAFSGSSAAPASPGLRIVPTPPPPPTPKPLSLASLRDYFDRSGISDAVVKSVEKIKNEVAGFGHLLGGF